MEARPTRVYQGDTFSVDWYTPSIDDVPGVAADWRLHSETHYAPHWKAGPLNEVLPPCVL